MVGVSSPSQYVPLSNPNHHENNSCKEILSVKHENVHTTLLTKNQRHQKRHSPLEFHPEVLSLSIIL
ncbi:hypothetical protein I3843_16G090500 [Carya illinoinensis]|nr:hypothetical protein I3843_16G090500 [Carya illinoinensis]